MGTIADGTERDGGYLRLENICKRYGDTAAADGVTLSVPRGCFLSLLGESGSGKTTLLRVIAGFEKPDCGRVYIGGRDVTDAPPSERGCRTVFQDLALFPHMSAAGNIAFVLRAGKRLCADGRYRRMSAAEARAEAERALAETGLAGMGSRKISTLSGGEKQRVAIARALASGADVMLLDEPFSSLDAVTRAGLRALLADLHARTPVTFVYVTHDREDAMRMSDRVAVLSGGRLLRCASPEEVYRDPQSAEAARLTGECGVLRAADGSEIFVRPEDVTFGSGEECVVTECAYGGGKYLITLLSPRGEVKAYSDREYAKGEKALFDIKSGSGGKAVKV